MPAPRGLHALARLYGLQTAYRANDGSRVAASTEGLMATLRALGVPVSSAGEIPRLLEHRRHAQARRRQCDCAGEVAVEAEHDPQRRRLAATRRADEAGEAARAKRELQVAQHPRLRTVGGAEGLGIDPDVKQPG